MTLEALRDHYDDLRQLAATLVYLRIKLAAEHPDDTAELARMCDEADRAKRALLATGQQLRAVERERLRDIAAASAERIDAITAEHELDRDLSGAALTDRIDERAPR